MSDDELGPEIAEEHEIWRKNCPVMYSEIKETVLEWPSLTVEWLPDSASHEKRALVGTNLGDEPDEGDFNYIAVIAPEIGGRPDEFGRIQSGPHEGEVNRARRNPHDSSLVATIGNSGDVYIWNLSEPGRPRYTCSEHTENGYGLAWSPKTPEQLLTGADDGKVILWNVPFNSNPTVKWSVSVETRVNDVTWAPCGERFAAAGENGHVYVYEITDNNVSLLRQFTASPNGRGINALAFSPFTSNLIATAGDDALAAVFDVRAPQPVLHVLSSHDGPVTSIKWSPHTDGVLATAGADRRVILWDLRRVGQELMADDAEDAVPELVFMHSGHTTPVSDFDWHPQHAWMLCSVSEDNLFQTWVPSPAAMGTNELPKIPKYLL